MRHIVIMGLLLVCSLQLKAQIDPTLAGMVYLYTEKAEDQLKAQERAMLMQTTGHIWTREEVEGTTDIQRKFNDYLDSFRDRTTNCAAMRETPLLWHSPRTATASTKS